MRIGCFEVSLSFFDIHCMSSVCSGRAQILKSLNVRNVRGSESDWLRLKVRVGNWESETKPLRGIAPGNEALDRCDRVIRELKLPAAFLSGEYDAFFSLTYSGGEETIPFRVTVLNPHYMSTDFSRAEELAAFLTPEEEEIRTFAEGLSSSKNILRMLYDRLLPKRLPYLDVPLCIYPDVQKIHSPRETLRSGGCCAEMSMLFASLLGAAGVSPLIIEFRDHMGCGCLRNADQNWLMMNNGQEVLRLLETEAIQLMDPTGVCNGITRQWEYCCGEITRRIRAGEPFVLVNTAYALRKAGVHYVFDRFYSGICPKCGKRTNNDSDNHFTCSACGFTMFFSEMRTRITYAAVDECRYKVSGHRAIVLLASARAKAISVSSVYNGHPVKEIAERAFADSLAEAVFLPADLEKLGDRAFLNCKHLHTIEMSGSLKTLGNGAFSGCEALESITLPGSISRIPPHAFYGCRNLKHVYLEEGLKEIGAYAFEGCVSLEEVIVPETVGRIKRNAFAGCTNLKGLRLLSQSTVLE